MKGMEWDLNYNLVECMIISFSSHSIPITLTRVQTLHFVKECSIPYHTYFLSKSHHTKFVPHSLFSKLYLLHFIHFFYLYSFYFISFIPTRHNISILDNGSGVMKQMMWAHNHIFWDNEVEWLVHDFIRILP